MSDTRGSCSARASLSIVIPFPGGVEIRAQSMGLPGHAPIPIYAADQEESAPNLPETLGLVFLEKGTEGHWRLKNPSLIHTDWVLFLEQDEFLNEEALSQVVEALPGLSGHPHMLAATRFLADDQITQFDWVTTRQVFLAPSSHLTGLHRMELRLVPTGVLGDLMVSGPFQEEREPRFSLDLPQNGREPSIKKLLPLTIARMQPEKSKEDRALPADWEIFARGHGNVYDDKKFVDEFEWPRTLYALIRNDHIPAIIRGLREGVTSRGIVMHTLKYLLGVGQFDRAAEIASLIPKHWRHGNATITHMQALAYFAAGEMEAAKNVLEESQPHGSEDAAILENVGKFHLLLGERQKAAATFQRCIELSEDSRSCSHLQTFVAILNEDVERRPTLTACVLCKDEQELLPKTLQSVRGLADEILVVDTGSCDRSRDIAREFGARVCHLPWEHDFSRARNFALQEARSDYVLMLDADEHLFVLDLIDFHVMKRLLPLGSPRAVALTIGHPKIETDWMNVLAGGGNFITESRSIRIVPRRPGVRYRGKVEEDVGYSLSQLAIPVTTLPEKQMRIYHAGLDRKRRLARKLPAYEQEVHAEVPLIMAAIRDYSQMGDKEGTIRWLEQLMDRGMRERHPSIPQMGIRLAALLEEQSPEEARLLLEKLVSQFEGETNVMMAFSSHLIRHGLFSDLANLSFEEVPELDRSNQSTLQPLVYRALIALAKQDLTRAVGLLDKVLSQFPDNLLGQSARFHLFCTLGDIRSATSALEDLLYLTNGENGAPVSSGVQFLRAVEQLSDRLGGWGHTVERALLLHSALLLSQYLEVDR